MWTLEGLGALDLGLVRESLKDPNPQMRIQAIRASETLYKAGQRALLDDYRAAAKDPDTDVMIQAMLTLHLFKAPDIPTIVKDAQTANKARGVQLIGDYLLAPVTTLSAGPAADNLPPEQRAALERGATIYGELCSICHGPDGRGTAGEGSGVMKAPSFVGSARVQGHQDYVIKAILHGLTGPLDGRTYSDVMVPMGSNRDDWVAAAASYLRMNFGNAASFVTPADVARVRAAIDRKTPWTQGELEASLPVALLPQDTWKITASHNAQVAAGGLNFQGWSTAAPQEPGMWFQIELPSAATVTEIQFIVDVPGRRSRRSAGRARRRRRSRTASASGRDLPARLPRAALHGRQHLGRAGRRRTGQWLDDGHRVSSGCGEVHPDHADRDRHRQRPVVDAAAPPVRGACARAWQRRAVEVSIRRRGITGVRGVCALAVLCVGLSLPASAQQYQARRDGDVVRLEDSRNQVVALDPAVGREPGLRAEGQRPQRPALDVRLRGRFPIAPRHGRRALSRALGRHPRRTGVLRQRQALRVRHGAWQRPRDAARSRLSRRPPANGRSSRHRPIGSQRG